MGADEVEHTGVGGGRGSVLCDSFAESEVKHSFCFERIIQFGFLGDRVEAFWRRCRGVEAMVLVGSDLGGRDVCLCDSRGACCGDEQGDQ